MSEMEESAKAITETAKLGQVSVEAGVKVGSFLAKILGEPLQDAVGIFGDKLKFMRMKRLIRIIDEVNKMIDEEGIVNMRPIPPKFAIPIMEYASLEEDDTLQDLWCKLLANGLDSTYNFELKYFYIDIIKSLTPLDVKILNYIFKDNLNVAIDIFNKTQAPSPIKSYPVSYDKIKMNVPAEDWEIRISLYNLMRVQCINDTKLSEAIKAIFILMEDKHSLITIEEAYILTPLGFNFMYACMHKPSNNATTYSNLFY